MKTAKTEKQLKVRIQLGILIFMGGLIVSGITAFPLETELSIAIHVFPPYTEFGKWIYQVYQALAHTNQQYPFMAYGTDWLAFAHLVIAVVFYGPLKDPIRNIWVIDFGLIACVMIFPLALIAGPIREIPFFHQLIDCAFGVIGGLVLLDVKRNIKRLESFNTPSH
ncbi:MAG: hypothetical protein CL840_20470 [Crocinitomicaceae bacterium]|nr:hypothetical protein [Crocinitomicaceae bacterium]|tara:strand:+ start:7518 stop:8015 length:498 start_codon:yes stop_codon:yes gene_type:complete